MHPLEAFRLRKGLSMADLAADLGISRPHLHRIINDQCDPSVALVRRVVVATGGAVSANDMLRSRVYAPSTQVNDLRGTGAA